MPLTFRGGSVVKFTAGIGAEVYSDRYCPSQESILEEIGKDRNGNPDPAGVQRVLDKYNALTQAEHLGDRCLGRGYNKDAPGSTSSNPIGFPNPIEAVARGTYDPNNPLFQVNGTPVLDDFLGLRFWVYAALEVAISEKVNFFAEGGFYPGTQRLLHTDAFNRAFPENDLGFSVRAGITAKFFGGATAKK